MSVARASTGNTITFTYTAADGGMSGGSLRLIVPSGWSAPSSSSAAAGYTTSSAGSVATSGNTITVSGLTLVAGATLTLTYGSTGGGGPGATASATSGAQTWATMQSSSASGALTSLAASPAVTVVAGALHHFTVEAAAGGPVGSQQAGVPFIVKITARDAGNTTVTGFDGTVDIDSNRAIAGGPFSTGSFVAGVLTQTITLTQGGLLSTLTATQSGGGVSGTSNAFTVFAADGSGTLTTPITYVRNGSGANTLAFTYTVPSGGLSNGVLSLEVPEGWSPPSGTAGDAGYVVTNTGTRSVSDRTITVAGLNRSEGQTVVITYGARANNGPGATAPTVSGPQGWVGKSRGLAGGTLVQLASSPQVTVLAPDGSGTIEPSPAFVGVASAGNTIVFTYTAAGAMVNGSVSLDVPTGWSAPSTSASAPGAVTASAGAVSVAGRTITVSGLTVNGGDMVTIVYGSRAGAGPGASAPTSGGSPAWMARERSNTAGTFVSLAASPAVSVVAGALHHFTVEAAAGGPVGSQQAGVPFTVRITAQDAGNTTVTGFDGTVDIDSNRAIAGGLFTSGPFVAGVLSQSITLTQAGLLSTITATQTGAGVSGTSNAFTVLAADGSGTFTTPTGFVRPGSTGNTLVFTYTAPAGGMVNGAISLEVPEGWPEPSTSGSDPGYFVTNKGTRSIAGRALIVSGLTRSEGETVVVTYGAKAGGGPGATAPTAPGPQSWVGKSNMLAGGSLASLSSSPQITVLAADGSGTMEPSPAFVGQSSSANTIAFAYTAAGPMVNGSLSLAVPSGWSAPSTSSSDAGAVTASAGAVSVAGRTITVSGLTLSGGDMVTIVYGSLAGTGPGASAPATAGAPVWVARQRSNTAGTFVSLAPPPAVRVVPGP